MSSLLVCPICGQTKECGPHEGPGHGIHEIEVKCPLKMGAIYVYVRDEMGFGVKDVRVKCDNDRPLSDSEGFAIFDPRSEGPHPTGIRLAESLDNVKQNYYLFSAESQVAGVRSGQITFLVFQLNRYATLEVLVKRSDKQDVLVRGVKIEVDSVSHPGLLTDTSRSEGPVSFASRKQVMHTVSASLTGADADNYKFDGDSVQQCILTAREDNIVQFLVTPAGWIEFKVFDQNGPLGQTATFTVECPGIAKGDKDTAAGALLSLPELEPGEVTIHTLTVPEGYELVEVKPE